MAILKGKRVGVSMYMTVKDLTLATNNFCEI